MHNMHIATKEKCAQCAHSNEGEMCTMCTEQGGESQFNAICNPGKSPPLQWRTHMQRLHKRRLTRVFQYCGRDFTKRRKVQCLPLQRSYFFVNIFTAIKKFVIDGVYIHLTGQTNQKIRGRCEPKFQLESMRADLRFSSSLLLI